MGKRKERESIPSGLAAMVLFWSDRTCCVCQVRGRPVQIHHIDDDPSNNTESNLAVLCFDCHRDTQIGGGFDRKLDAAQVLLYRDDWLTRVERRRGNTELPVYVTEGFQVYIEKASDAPAEGGLISLEDSGLGQLADLIRSLPERRRLAYHQAQAGWDTGITLDMVAASGSVINTLKEMLVELAGYYPAGP